MQVPIQIGIYNSELIITQLCHSQDLLSLKKMLLRNSKHYYCKPKIWT